MFQHLPHLTGPFEAIYRRTPRGLARVVVAGVSGALFCLIVVLGRDGKIAREYWYIFAAVGLAIGLIGGAFLGMLEHREAQGIAAPAWWTISRRIALTFLKLLGLALLLFLLYLVQQIAFDDRLSGF